MGCLAKKEPFGHSPVRMDDWYDPPLFLSLAVEERDPEFIGVLDSYGLPIYRFWNPIGFLAEIEE